MRTATIVLILSALGIVLSACSTPVEYDHVCTADELAAEACTQEYMPVCGDNGETYGNGCTACLSGEIDAYDEGACS